MAEKEKKNKKEKKSKKSSMFWLLVILFLICICALWLSGFDFGFGSGGASVGGNDGSETLPEMSETPVSVSETVSETETSAEDDGLIAIVVSEGGIMYKNEAVADAAALKERILADMDDGVLFVLRDDHAVKSLYDEVKAVLDETGAVYSVEQGEGQS